MKVSKAEKHDPALHMEMETLRAQKAEEKQAQIEQADREQRIAECHEVIGRIQGVKMVADFANVGGLLWLKQVRETKLYKDLPNVGTWENFCKYIGSSRQKVEEDLENLAVFGEKFTTTVGAFGVGYRELRKLRQLTHDGAVVVGEDNTITIGDKAIPVDEDHAEDIQAAIEWILDENKEIAKRVEKLEKTFDAAVKEETKGLHLEKKALLAENKRLQVFAPEGHDETWCEEQIQVIATDCDALTASINAFIIDPRLQGDRPAQAQVLRYMNQAETLLQDLRDRFESAYTRGE